MSLTPSMVSRCVGSVHHEHRLPRALTLHGSIEQLREFKVTKKKSNLKGGLELKYSRDGVDWHKRRIGSLKLRPARPIGMSAHPRERDTPGHSLISSYLVPRYRSTASGCTF